MNTFRQWVFAKPMVDQVLSLDQFEQRELPLPDLQDGQALVRVKLINIHSGTRARMASGATRLGETDLTNYACAQVVHSRDPVFKPGDVIACQAGWQDYQIIRSADESVGYGPAREAVKDLNRTNSHWTYVFRPELVRQFPPEVLMDTFGTSGLTAFFGMQSCGPLQPGEAVAVAGATGSVGSIAVQLAKIAGCHVAGFAGGAQGCHWVRESLGADHCIDYRAADFAAQLNAAFPLGIDVFSDGIGGTLTETVAQHMKQNGRLFAYGSAAAFYADQLSAMPLLGTSLRRAFGVSEAVERIVSVRNIKVEAWIVHQFYHRRLQAEDALSELMRAGLLKPINNVVDGFENLPAAIVSLYAGARSGKLQVSFDER